MITSFFAGYFFALISSFIIAHYAQKFAIKKGWYASAIWNEKEKTWKVRGNYLHTASKILRSLRGQSTENVKYVD